MKRTKDNIQIEITKKDSVYLAIIFSLVCIIAIVCILIPRYYKTKDANLPAQPSQAVSNNDQNAQSNGATNSGSETKSEDNTFKNNDFGAQTDNNSSKSEQNSQANDDTSNGSQSSQANDDTSKGDVSDNDSETNSETKPDDKTNSDAEAKSDSGVSNKENSNIDAETFYSSTVLRQLASLEKPFSFMSKFLSSDKNLDKNGLKLTQSQIEEIENLALPIYNLLQGLTQSGEQLSADLITSNDKLYSSVNALNNYLNSIYDNL